MTPTPFDPTKPVMTRDGLKARIICTDRKGLDKIIALVENRGGTEEATYHKPDGRYYEKEDSRHDLLNISETRRVERWFNVYLDSSGNPYLSRPAMTKQGADRDAREDRFAILHINQEIKQGEGM